MTTHPEYRIFAYFITFHNQGVWFYFFLHPTLSPSIPGPIIFLLPCFFLFSFLGWKIKAGGWLFWSQMHNVMPYLKFDFRLSLWGISVLLLWPSLVTPQDNGSIQPAKHPIACQYEILAIIEVGRLRSGWKTFPIDHSRVWWTCLKRIDLTHWFFLSENLMNAFKSQYFLCCILFYSEERFETN